MKQIILGTAGHIDHGKTTLIKALTGTDTDRLKEEKLRGITIELGFASIDLPNGQHVGIVDVPGHEKFVKNMVAGATGIDLVVMVIAADEGVMQQTREHMEICTLLDIKHGFIALTKVDLVDEEWLELVMDDLNDFTRGTFLEDAPVVPVSSTTGKGIPEFIEILDKLCMDIPQRQQSSLFRLPVDRVFSMKGFGTVITGTLTSGKVKVGETIMVYPSGIVSKVRGIQVHGKAVEEAFAGMRTAINFQGLDKEFVNRGDILANPEILKTSHLIDANLHYLESNLKRIKNRTRVRFHTGTSEVIGNLIPLEDEEISPGETKLVQLRLDSPVNCVKDDKFVIRSYSPVRTIGGGQVLNPIPMKHKRFKQDVIKGLQSLLTGEHDTIVSQSVIQAKYEGVAFSDLKIMTNIPEKKLDKAIQNLLNKKIIVQSNKENRIFVHGEIFQNLTKEMETQLLSYHKVNPLKEGMPKEELRSKFSFIKDAKLFHLILTQMTRKNKIVQEESNVRLESHKVALQVNLEDVKRKIIEIYKKDGLTPPYFKTVVQSFNIDQGQVKDVLALLIDAGEILKIKEDLYYHPEVVEELKKRVIDFLKKSGEITTPQFKDMTGISRKYVIPLIEYFDSINLTIRVGDTRQLRGVHK